MEREIASLVPDPARPGAATATMSDGSSIYAPAEQLQAAYDRQQAARKSQMLASNAPGFSMVPDQSTDTRGPLAPDVLAQRQNNAEDQARQAAAAKQSQAYRALGVTGRDMAIAQQMGMDPITVAANKTYAPGHAAFDPNKYNQSLGVVRTGQQTVTDKGHPVDEDQLNRVQNLQLEAADKLAQASNIKADAERMQAAQVAMGTAAQADQQARELQAREADWKARYNTYTQQVDEANKTPVDRNRWFKNQGLAGKIALVLGSIIQGGAMGYNKQSGPTAVERYIDQDIAEQQREIAAKRGGAENALARMSQEWGSLEAGRAALKIAQQKTLDTQLEAMAQYRLTPAQKAAVEGQRAQLAESMAREEMTLRAAAEGTSRVVESGQYMAPQKAQGGGVRYNLKGLDAATQRERENEIKEAAAKGNLMGGEHGIYARAGKLGEQLATLEESQAMSKDYFESIGLRRNPKTGKWEKPAGFDNPMSGPWDATTEALSSAGADMRDDQQRRASANLTAAVESFGRARSGAAIGEGEEKRFADMLRGKTGADAAEAANALERLLSARADTLRAGAGTDATDFLDQQRQRQQQIRYSNNTAAARSPLHQGEK